LKVVIHTCNLSTPEAEARRIMNSRPVYATRTILKKYDPIL
jgi:hypothetical protein